ncbi:MAG: DUF3365 domain-containing protein [Magnetococcales bacterium]|nr:DUF3365 domain-containing protein [Magnetococcales bacterium]
MSLKTRFLSAITVVLLLVILGDAWWFGRTSARGLVQQFRDRAELMLQFASASREFVKEELRPAMDRSGRGFSLETHSSTFVTARIFDRFHQMAEGYHLRQPSLNPLNAANRATPEEEALIHQFRQASSKKEISGFTDNGDHFFLARPVKVEEGCLHCHGEASKAPQTVVERYGNSHGFGWKTGEVIAAMVVSIDARHVTEPLRSSALMVAAVFGLLFIAIWLGIHFFFERLVNRRLLGFGATMERVAANPDVVQRINDGQNDEIGAMAISFNRMSSVLVESRQALRRQLGELEESHLRLTREISERSLAQRRVQMFLRQQTVVNDILRNAVSRRPLQDQMAEALDALLAFPWLMSQRKGAIFLARADDMGVVGLCVQRGFSASLRETCRTIKPGLCHCGMAINTRQLVFSDRVDERHAIRHPHMLPHGHYCVPMLSSQDRLEGLLTLYLDEGHVRNEEEEKFLTSVAGVLAGVVERHRMEEAIATQNEELKKARLDLIHRLGMAAEYRDIDTGNHVVRMSHYAACLAREAGLPEVQCEVMLCAAPMHDLGKIGVPDSILLKPGRLTPEEYEAIKEHSVIGSSMLQGFTMEPMKMAHIIALTHHERWDGAGYPLGLSGEEIPLPGRVCAIADVFDALTSERPYKKAWSVEQAVREVVTNSGKAFDPFLVTCFLRVLPQIVEIRGRFED